ncbi:MAG: type II toxin-antitoxin system PemK/MazF family toxin [Candidatus Marinimicrobia bacterium]|nr:type II toxin-antitoxin system PemK/MazF family toxin [Candidatus Neomarinimicrobiota bacterium]
MEETMQLKKWDIVLINLKTNRKRPALVISPERHNATHDIIVLFITSNLNATKEIGDYQLIHWREANLPKPAIVKMVFSTVHKKHLKPLGKLSSEDIINFEKKFNDFFNQS